MNRLAEAGGVDLTGLGLRLYRHGERGNTLIVLCPRLEDWLTAAARDAGLRLDNRRYGLPVNAGDLHGVINNELPNLELLIDDLLSAQSPRILRLQTLLTG